jgi:hypothetical protein
MEVGRDGSISFRPPAELEVQRFEIPQYGRDEF